jgi:hypothetical protein
MESQADPNAAIGMPLGIKIYEAMFSYEPTARELGKDVSNGPMAYDHEHFDDLVDMLEKADPKTVEVLLRMLEMQTRQNIVSMLCKSGGLVAFTASELGLSDRTVERASNGMNIMKPPAFPAAPGNGSGEPASAAAPQAAPVNPAQAYYGLGAPKGQHPPKAT